MGNRPDNLSISTQLRAIDMPSTSHCNHVQEWFQTHGEMCQWLAGQRSCYASPNNYIRDQDGDVVGVWYFAEFSTKTKSGSAEFTDDELAMRADFGGFPLPRDNCVGSDEGCQCAQCRDETDHEETFQEALNRGDPEAVAMSQDPTSNGYGATPDDWREQEMTKALLADAWRDALNIVTPAGLRVTAMANFMAGLNDEIEDEKRR